MSHLHFDCSKCTNKAVRADGWTYCLPMVRDGRNTLVWEWGSCTDEDHCHCTEFTTEPRTPAIYEAVVRPFDPEECYRKAREEGLL